MVQHYFVSAWIPPRDENNNFSLRKLSGQDVYLMGFTGEKIHVAPGAYGEYNAQFYVGPKDQVALEELGRVPGPNRGLRFPVDVGQTDICGDEVYPFCCWQLGLVDYFADHWHQDSVCTHCQRPALRSMAKMRSLQPKMERLKETYGDDRQKMSQELMGLYTRKRR